MNSFSVSNAMDHKIYQYKIILLGDIAVGKTCVLSRFMNNTFTNIYKCNVGVDYRSKTVTFDNKIGYELILTESTNVIWHKKENENYTVNIINRFLNNYPCALEIYDNYRE